MIILVGGEKGGTGKTTIATNLAAMRAKTHDVLLVDTDTQGSAAMWAQIRQEEGVKPSVTCVRIHGAGVASEVRKLAPRFADVVIDSGGRDSIELRQAMVVADVMVIPARPSQLDLHGLAAVEQIVGQARAVNPGLRVMVVINCATTHATNTDAQEMREVIAEMPNLTLGRSVLRDRLSFRRSVRDGVCVLEYKPVDEKAVQEMRQLFKETFA